MEQEQGSNKIGRIAIVVIFVGILWGLPSLFQGKGFVNGIFENIYALFYLIGIFLGGYILFKIFSK